MDDLAPKPPLGCFVDRTHKPTAAGVLAALGDAGAAWKELARYLADVHGLTAPFTSCTANDTDGLFGWSAAGASLWQCTRIGDI